MFCCVANPVRSLGAGRRQGTGFTNAAHLCSYPDKKRCPQGHSSYGHGCSQHPFSLMKAPRGGVLQPLLIVAVIQYLQKWKLPNRL